LIAIDAVTANTTRGEEIVRFCCVNSNQELICNLLVKASNNITSWGISGITDEEYDLYPFITQTDLREIFNKYLSNKVLIGYNLEKIFSLLNKHSNEFETRDIGFFCKYRRHNNLVKGLPEIVKDV